MGFGDAVKSGFAKYSTFSGRATRSEYWWWWLFTALVFGATVVLILLGSSSDGVSAIGVFGWVLYAVAAIGLIVPSLAVLVRRLHDTGRSGWWYFISLVPCIGGIWLLVLLVSESTAGQNQYG
ncbi:MAG: DUF805 domain-containing protein [Actinomycetes bacterium]